MPARRRFSFTHCHVQPLERRRLLAFTAEIVGTELRLTGTDADETVDVSVAGDQIGVSRLSGMDVIATFDRDAILLIVVDAGAGNDFVRVTVDLPAQIAGGRGNDTLAGGSIGDSINGGQGDDRVHGNGGEDTLDGSGGDDRIIDDADESSGFADWLIGNAGSDTLISNGGSDILDGGSELGRGDSADFSGRSNASLSLSLDGVANDGTAGETGNLLDVENIVGGAGNDTITGNARANSLVGWEGDDTLFGLGGDDFLGGGDDTPESLIGGDDLLDGGSGNDNFNGGVGDDTLLGQGGADQLIGYNGNDSLDGGTGDDGLSAVEPFGQGTGLDTLIGGAGDDLLEASNPTPETLGASLLGGSGNDVFSVHGRLDVTVVGAGGNDAVFAAFDSLSHTGGGAFSGGSGSDSFQVTDTTDVGVSISLDGAANDGFTGGAAHNIAADFESVYGGNGDDAIDASAAPHGMTLWGGPLSPDGAEAGGADGNDTLTGSAFADLIEAGKGDDSLVGNAGEDVLRGSVGKDTLTGGPGIDSFNGGPENDLIEAVDGGTADVVNGSSGLGDRADVDDGIDVVIHVEIVT